MIIKKSLTVLKTSYMQWLLSSRLLIFAFVYMFLFVYFISPMKEMSDFFSTPLNIIEPFVSIMNNGYFLPLTALTYLILISDQPKLGDHGTLMLFRTGRIPWILGQIWFIICSALTFISFILISSMISVANRSFLLNAWSLVSKKSISPEYTADLSQKYPFAVIDSSVIKQSRPYTAVVHAILLMMMFMLSVGLAMLIFSLLNKKVIGIFANLSFIVVGLVLWVVDVKVKWFFSIANSAFGWHYDGMYDKSLMSIEYSYIYFIIVCTALIVCMFLVGKRCSFYIVGGTE